MQRSLRNETIFYGISKYTNVFVTLLTTSVLSRILEPSEFGVVSVVTVFTAFFAVLSDMGLGTAVIQDKTLTDEDTNDIFSFSVFVSVLLGVLFLALGWPIAWFYGDPVYVKICFFLSISVFFNSVNIIPNAVLMKLKKFRLVGQRLIVVSVITGIVAVMMALLGCSYYAIVFQSVFQAMLIFAWNYWNTRPVFTLRFNKESIKKIKQYSAYQFSYSLINYFARNLDNLLIGKALGSVSLAYYDKGYKLMMYPVQNLTYVINPILHPILSDHQKNKVYIYDAYMKVVRILSLLGLFISALCFWASEEIIMVFFGNQWENSVPIFRLLSLSVWPQLVSTSAGSIYQSTGNTKLMFKSGLIHFGVAIILILIGVLTHKIMIVALLVTIGLYLRFFVDYYFLITKGLQKSFCRFLAEFRGDMAIMIFMIITIAMLYEVKADNVLLSLVLKLIVLGAVYIVSVLLTGQVKYITVLFRRKNS